MLEALDDPEVRPFLPMIYVAWADGELSAQELSSFRQYIDRMPWLGRQARDTLKAWLDPSKPPTAAQLRWLFARIEAAAGTLATHRRRDLAEIAATLSDDDPRVQRAIEELLRVLDIDGLEAGGAFCSVHSRQPEPPTVGAVSASARDTFDPQQLLDCLEPDHRALRGKIRSYLADPTSRIERDQSKESSRAAVLDQVKRLAEAELGKLAYPGVTTDEADMGAFMAAFEMLGYGDLSTLVKFGVQFGLFGGSIYFLGNEDQRRSYLPQIAAGDLLGCYAMTELGHGSNVDGLETTLSYDRARDVIVVHTPDVSARKEWIGGAARDARMATVYGQLLVDGEQHGVHAVLVPIRDESGHPLPGVRTDDCGHKLGLNGVDNGRLWFDGVRVPRSNLLGRFSHIDGDGRYHSTIANPNRRFFTMLGTLVAGRISVAAGAVSASKVGLEIAIRYALHRRQFGLPGEPEMRLMQYPMHRRRLMPVLAQAFAASFAVEKVRRDYLATESGADTRVLEATAAGVKAFATDHATAALQQCRECCGGQGYLSANRIGPLKSDTDVFTTFEGDNTVLLQLTAKALLTDFRKQFLDDRVFGLFRFVGKKLTRIATQANPIQARISSASHLRSRDTQRGLLLFREADLIESAAARIRKRTGAGMRPSEAFIAIQTHLVAMARAHVERVVFDAFCEAVDSLEGERERDALERLACLWALWRIESDLGWFMENGVAEPGRASAVRREVQRLCDEAAEDALNYVKAFGIPEASLAAPIAFGASAGV